MSGAKIDADGKMSMANRSITTGDVDSKAVSTSGMPLAPADTARVRTLAAEALERCVK
jgi:hypothetical protein